MLNAASWFVDRNVDEGRGALARGPLWRPDAHVRGRPGARRTARGTPSPSSASAREDRVLLLCHDAPEFVGAFWGAIKIGAVPVPVNTLPASRRNGSTAWRTAAPASSSLSAPLLAEAAAAMLGAAPRTARTCSSRAGRRARICPTRSAARARSRTLDGRPHVARRSRLLALLVRIDGSAQGGRPSPARHARLQRHVRAAHPRRSGRRTSCSPRPSCSSPTASAPPATSRPAWARSASCTRSG